MQGRRRRAPDDEEGRRTTACRGVRPLSRRSREAADICRDVFASCRSGHRDPGRQIRLVARFGLPSTHHLSSSALFC